jgi:L-asparaginase II
MTLLAQVVRSGFVECEHQGSVIALDPDGRELLRAGDPDRPIFPRSSNKPLQAMGMLRAGLTLPPDELAMASASHSGEQMHVDRVRRMLAGAGLTEADLQCPPAWPADEDTHVRLLRAGATPTRVRMNCSGKHAGMLAACVAAGWPTETYLDPDHPLQQLIRQTAEELTGEPCAAVGVDGCGAPLLAFSLTGLARAFSRIATAPDGTAEHRLAQAVRQYPELVSGSTRPDRALAAGVPGLFAKGGAEACYVAALPDGRAVAVKIDDGGDRARAVVMAEALRRLGVDEPVVREQLTAPVYGGGRVVGEVRPTNW